MHCHLEASIDRSRCQYQLIPGITLAGKDLDRRGISDRRQHRKRKQHVVRASAYGSGCCASPLRKRNHASISSACPFDEDVNEFFFRSE